MWSAPSYLAGAGLAALAVATWERGWFGWLAVLALPFYLVFRSYDSIVARLRKEQDQTRHAMDVQLATIEALALAIEAKAGCTPEHIRSIQQYAGMLAIAAGLPESDVQTIRTAALLHDVGNMAIPEHILSKPDKLTPEEFERVKMHTRVGADILRDVPFDGPVNELVLSHHERWDGLGYPAGLRGEDIPIGARILAIADCYTTLLTDRPYRAARNEAEALNVVRDFAGTAYDPALVHLFVEQLKGIGAASAAGNANGPRVQNDESVALRDIAGAHREEQTLYEIAQALGASLGIEEAMALIQEKVSRLVPSSTWALFLGSEQDGYACRYAHGAGTEALVKWKAKTWSELSLRLPSQADGRGAHGEELRSLLPCPLTLDGELIGGIVIYHTVPGCFTDDHRRILGRVSEQAAAVICNSTRFEQTQYESQTDPLTGLANRRSLERHVDGALARAAEQHRSVSVVVLDLDRLKEINDTYGHEAGDRALRAIGLTLRTTVRPSDMCARFGGDEYVVVLGECTAEQADERVREFQRAVALHPFEPRPGVRLSLSISAGAARFPADGRTFDELLAVGDERMYCDKAGRRTRHTVTAAKQERA
jgi:diguanylate cyclase (GGDEF)-like protein/putative nucleotidyltransferase with HDIG domain